MPKRKRKANFTKPSRRKSSSISRKHASQGPSSRINRTRPNTIRTHSTERDNEETQSDSGHISGGDTSDDGVGEHEQPGLVSEKLDDLNGKTDREDHEEHEMEDENEHPDDSNAAAPILAPRLAPEIVWVRTETISKKWDTLDTASQRAVQTIFADVARPAIASRLGDRIGKDAQDADGRSAEAQVAVEGVVQGLARKLHRVPVPPQSSVDVFDYELTRRNTSAAEMQLSDHMAAIASLKTEIKQHETSTQQAVVEMALLQKEIQERRSAHFKRLQSKNAKYLGIPSEEPEDSARLIHLGPRPKRRIVFDAKEDLSPDVAKLMDQMGRHVANIHANRSHLGDLEQELDWTIAHETRRGIHDLGVHIEAG